MFRTEFERHCDIIALDHHVMIPWEVIDRAGVECEDLFRWCDEQFGPEGFAWTWVRDPNNNGVNIWFVCFEFAFEFKIRFR
jgi:hypothetical protein